MALEVDSFDPLELGFFRLYPRLTPWVLFWRRFAATRFRG
jgi:hypothetical protein